MIDQLPDIAVSYPISALEISADHTICDRSIVRKRIGNRKKDTTKKAAWHNAHVP